MTVTFVSSVTPTARRTISSPVGPLTLMGDGEHLTHLLFDHQAADVVGTLEAPPVESSTFAAEPVDQLDDYFAGRRTDFDLLVAPRGTAFQLDVWRALTTIPYGTTVSYGELAVRVGRPAAARAVGAANGRNPISIIVPCHRVIGASGDLTGYGGGLDRKSLLLDLEHDHTAPRLPLGV